MQNQNKRCKHSFDFTFYKFLYLAVFTSVNMTDIYLDVNSSSGKSNVGPISQGGRVVVNGHFDTIHLNEIKKNLKSQISAYPGPLDTQHIYTRQSDLLVRTKTIYGRRHDLNAPLNAVWSTTNGAFLKSQKYWEKLESVEFAGFAQYMTDNDNDLGQNGLVCVIGGLLTVKNTGPHKINNGDLILWDLPDIKNPTEYGKPNSERQPFLTVPYAPLRNSMNITMVSEMLDKPPAPSADETQLVQAIAKYGSSLHQIAFLAVVAALQSGIVM